MNGVPSEGAYDRSIRRDQRGLFVFLLDQSASMSEPLRGEAYTKGEVATDLLNLLIDTIMHQAKVDTRTRLRKDYCDLLVIGYGATAYPLLGTPDAPVPLSQLERLRKSLTDVEYDDGETRAVKEVGVWVEYRADGEHTQMVYALDLAREAACQWIQREEIRRLKSFPPVVIQITDGQHNGTGDPFKAASDLCTERTVDGNVLLFNCHVTTDDFSGNRRISFPSNVAEVRRIFDCAAQPAGTAREDCEKERAWAETLFRMSSVVPQTMSKPSARAARPPQVNLPAGARGFVYNADAQDLISFLQFGTQAIPREIAWSRR